MEQKERIVSEERPGVASDLKLVAELLSKDRKAAAEFVARQADYIYTYVRRRLMPRPDAADDLVQEVFLAAWQGLDRFRGQASLRQWLLGIARHKIEDYYRKRVREIELPDNDREHTCEPAIFPAYEEEFDRALMQDKVRSIMATLPEPYGLILLWRYSEDRSVREMAQLTGKTEKAIERLLARARESFRRSWGHDGQ